MRVLVSALVLLCAFVALPAAAIAQPAIAEGQVWTVKDAPAETARVAIRKIEVWRDTQAVHVSVYGLPSTASGFSGKIEHLPFDRKALEGSLLTLTGEAPPADLPFEGGYAQWKSANGGIFTIPVMEAVRNALRTAFGRARSRGQR